MKIIKLTLDIITLGIITILVLVFTLREEQELLPGSHTILNISAWDYSHNKQEIYETIESISQKENITIYKSISNTNQNTDKYIYSFNEEKPKFQNHIRYKYINYDTLLSKDVRGKYFVMGDSFDSRHIKQLLQEKGVESEILSLNKFVLFLSVINDKGLLFPMTSILILYVFYFLQIANIKFKEYGIKKLHGYSISKIISEDMLKKCLYYTSLLSVFLISIIILSLVLDISDNNFIFIVRVFLGVIILFSILFLISLCSYTLFIKTDIPLIIKGKKPYTLLRMITVSFKIIILFVLVILLVQNLSSDHELKKIKETETYWSKLDDYYVIEVAPLKYTHSEENDISKKFHKLISNTEAKRESLLVRHNNLYHPQPTNYTPENGNVIFLNSNFIDFYNSAFKTQFELSDSKNTIDLLLPPKAHIFQQAIKKDFKDWINFQRDNDNQIKEINMKQTNDNFEIYTFDTRSSLKNNFSKNPLVVLIDTTDLGDNFYYSSVTQGSYLFKDYENTNKYLKEYGLEDVVSGVTNYKDIVLKDFEELNIKILIVSISILLSFITLVLTIIFDIQQYFEKNMKFLMIRKIHGFNLIKNNSKYLLLSNGLVILVGVISITVMKNSAILLLFIFIIIIQILIQSIYINKLEKNNLFNLKELE